MSGPSTPFLFWPTVESYKLDAGKQCSRRGTDKKYSNRKPRIFGAMSSRTPQRTCLPHPFQIDPDFENGIKDELH
jgi:hypothetical protein